MASVTPFHDIAALLDSIAVDLRALGDAVALGTFTLPVTPTEEPVPIPTEQPV